MKHSSKNSSSNNPVRCCGDCIYGQRLETKDETCTDSIFFSAYDDASDCEFFVAHTTVSSRDVAKWLELHKTTAFDCDGRIVLGLENLRWHNLMDYLVKGELPPERNTIL